jgi:integrase/recombinase XerD
MMKNYTIGLYLDTRREKASKKYPVKLRIFANNLNKKKYYTTKYDFSKNEYDAIMQSTKPRKEIREIRSKFNELINKAEKIAEQLNPFTFEAFEKKMYMKQADRSNVYCFYQTIIDDNIKQDRIGNASSFERSMKSIKAYLKEISGRESTVLKFTEITPSWLESFEKYMIDKNSRSTTTVGMYLRALRFVYNKAIAEEAIQETIYPFGSDKYIIPESENVKKALDREQLSKLFRAEPRTFEQVKAKDFWLFSYFCNGINIKDIAALRYGNIKNDKFTFYRAKTFRTAKKKRKEITVYLNDYTKSIIKKYGNPDTAPENLIFDIISDNNTATENFKKVNNFVRYINQHIKKLAIAEGLPKDISVYFARHTFSTMAIRNGATIEFISNALGHTDIKTTQSYFAGFEDKKLKEFAENLMNF